MMDTDVIGRRADDERATLEELSGDPVAVAPARPSLADRARGDRGDRVRRLRGHVDAVGNDRARPGRARGLVADVGAGCHAVPRHARPATGDRAVPAASRRVGDRLCLRPGPRDVGGAVSTFPSRTGEPSSAGTTSRSAPMASGSARPRWSPPRRHCLPRFASADPRVEAGALTTIRTWNGPRRPARVDLRA